MTRSLGVAKAHQKRIAIKTLSMHEEVGRYALLGGPTAREAVNILRRMNTSDSELRRIMERAGHSVAYIAEVLERASPLAMAAK